MSVIVRYEAILYEAERKDKRARKAHGFPVIHAEYMRAVRRPDARGARMYAQNSRARLKKSAKARGLPEMRQRLINSEKVRSAETCEKISVSALDK
ncbi:hypothetical protein B5F39_06105 [Cloacibacillus sp. An23]|nr:hypothetical protein B5F39_06105 [Cloacibacillus sp. An23]